MNCPSCNKKTNSDICSICGANNTLYKKIHDISNVLYNKGLAQSKEGNLSGAIISLKRSLQFDRRNYQAYNVLGLVYFECGKVADAIKQWIVSASVKKNDNLAKDYIEVFEKNAIVMEKLNDSIKMYNQALIYIKQKSEDMAVIRLKKAIELNPSFVEALNLLAFCYFILKDNRKAAVCVERVLEIDANNAKALSYFREMGQARSQTQTTEKIKVLSKTAYKDSTSISPASRININQDKTFGAGISIKGILIFAAGVAVSFIVIYIILMPAALRGKEKEIAQMVEEFSGKETSYNIEMSEYKKTIDDLTNVKTTLQEQKNILEETVEKQERTQGILTASSVLQNGDYETAAALLEGFDSTGLSEEIKELYSDSMLGSYSQIQKNAYTEGTQLYNNRKYEEAKPFFEKTIRYTTLDSQYTGDALYFLGRIAEVDEDINAAKTYYERVINDYPTTSQINRAKNQLARLE